MHSARESWKSDRLGRWNLAAVAAMFCTLDAELTLLSQPAEYWAGDYSQAVEFNPLAHIAISFHPVAFVLLAVVWAASVAAVVICWNHPLSRWLGWLVAIGHIFASAAWFWRAPVFGSITAIAVLVLGVALTNNAWRRASDPRLQSTLPDAE